MKKFKSPNYTQVPNEFLDNVLPEGLSKAELTVCLVLMRETFGFHRSCTELLTVDELQARTGLSRTAVVSGLKEAMERGYVGRRRQGDGTVYEVYGVRVEEDESRKLLPTPKVGKSYRGSRKKLPPSNKGKKTLRGKEKQKGADAPESAKKATIKGKPGQTFKPDPESEVHSVIVELFELWRVETKQPPHTTLTVKRAQQILARLREQAEGHEPAVALAAAKEQLLEALRGWFASDWHRDRNAFDFEVLFRSRQKVDMFRGRHHREPAPGPADNGFAAFSEVIERA